MRQLPAPPRPDITRGTVTARGPFGWSVTVPVEIMDVPGETVGPEEQEEAS